MKKAMLCVFVLFVFTGCSKHVTVNKDFSIPNDSKFIVAEVVNICGVNPEGESSEKLLRDAVEKAMLESGMPIGEEDIELHLSITEYSPGDAFKRWLMPGWGETRLTVKCKIVDKKSQNEGEIEVQRSIAAGGGFTAGAWKYVFDEVAKEIVNKIGEKTVKI